MTPAYAYFRTSSSTNVGPDKDSLPRQQRAVHELADTWGYELKAEFYDEATKGSEPVTSRPGFADMLAWLGRGEVKTVLVESASRFARDLIVQETGYAHLKERGITLVAADDPDAFTSDTPTAVMIRQILGAVAQFEKASLVARLKAARDRKVAITGKPCGGQPGASPACKAMARRLRKQGLSIAKVSARLAEAGYLAPNGKPYWSQSIVRML